MELGTRGRCSFRTLRMDRLLGRNSVVRFVAEQWSKTLRNRWIGKWKLTSVVQLLAALILLLGITLVSDGLNTELQTLHSITMPSTL